MARPVGVTAMGESEAHGKPLAVPLDVAAKALDLPMTKIMDATKGIAPLRHFDGHDVFLLRELRVALGLAQAGQVQITKAERDALNGTRHLKRRTA